MKHFSIAIHLRSKNYTHHGKAMAQVRIQGIFKSQKAFVETVNEKTNSCLSLSHFSTYGYKNTNLKEEQTIGELYVDGNLLFLVDKNGDTVRIDKAIPLGDF